MAKSAFITGIAGQDGAYLAKLLLKKGYEVHGGAHRRGVRATGRLRQLGIESDVQLHDFDLSEISAMQRVLDQIGPDEIYNLAGQSVVGRSFQKPVATANIIALGALRILELIRTYKYMSKFYQASTAEMFGNTQDSPQTEATSFCPRSPYGFSKLFAHWSTVNYRETHDIFACSGILFNHESPLRGTTFITRKITLGLANIKHGKSKILELGNLDARRDWGFAGDYVAGMWAMLQSERPDDYILATGETRTVRSFVEVAAARLGIEIAWRGAGLEEQGVDVRSGNAIVRISPEFFRPAEVNVLVGSALKAEKVLGWRRRVSFEQLVAMMVESDERLVMDGRNLALSG